MSIKKPNKDGWQTSGPMGPTGNVTGKRSLQKSMQYDGKPISGKIKLTPKTGSLYNLIKEN